MRTGVSRGPSSGPPGHTRRVEAASALVLAPHHDDEVLGCGGLLRQLTAAGATVRVLFVSDGADADVEEDRASRQAYAERRRQESAAAAAVLGIARAEHLGLLDGELTERHEEIVVAVRRILLGFRPDLVLAPSPFEVSPDHRAVFAALWETLAGTREGSELARVAAEVRVLLYEVNHPQHPDLLVDVSRELDAIGAAMTAYASQQERHDYLAASLGLRRFRTLTLPPQVEAAEAYRGLRLEDFTTRSLEGLVAHLGAAARWPPRDEIVDGPLVTVVVRTADRPELLAEALASVAASSYRRLEVVVADDGGSEAELPDEYPFPLRRVEVGGKGRAAAANRGVAAAEGDYVTFLDDDDLMEPSHLATLVGLVSAAGVRIAYTDAAVSVLELTDDGWLEVERRLPYSRDFDPNLLLVDNYIPFNTLLIERRLLEAVGAFDEELPFFEDWEMLIRLAEEAAFHHLPRVTCEYRHFRGGSQVFGERPRDRPDFLDVKCRVIERHRHRLDAEALARVVDDLKAEVVAGAEELEAMRSARDEMVERVAEAEARAARLNGEVESLRAERRRLEGEIETLSEEARRLQAEERRLVAENGELRRAVDEQSDHIGRLYAEIERLTGRIEAMRSTRAWRLHQRLERWRGRGRRGDEGRAAATE